MVKAGLDMGLLVEEEELWDCLEVVGGYQEVVEESNVAGSDCFR